MSEFILLKSYFHKHDAQIAVGLLKDGGIDALLQSDDAGGFRPHLTFSMGNNRILVHKKDAEKAMQIIQTLDENYSEQELKEIEEMAVAKQTPVPKKKKNRAKKDLTLWIPAVIGGVFLVTYVIREIHKQDVLDFEWTYEDNTQKQTAQMKNDQTDISGITQAQAQQAAVDFLKESNLDWGTPSRVRNTVGVSPKGNKWFAVEFDQSSANPPFILVNPDTGEAEFPLRR